MFRPAWVIFRFYSKREKFLVTLQYFCCIVVFIFFVLVSLVFAIGGIFVLMLLVIVTLNYFLTFVG